MRALIYFNALFYVSKTLAMISSSHCATLATKLSIANSSAVTSESHVAGTSIVIPNAAFGCNTSANITADICRVTMNITTSSSSHIYMEVWLPYDWDGRYVSTGGSGIGGCISYNDVAYLTGLGLAAGGSNGGHDGQSGQAFYHNIEVVKDFSYRALHVLTVAGKQITKEYYSSYPKYSYYFGCSTGGRQGLQAAQMYPDDFDGISAGAAAADCNNLVSWTGAFYLYTGTPSMTTFVTERQWTAIHNEVLRQCDGLDGVLDGIIEDPDLCNFNPDLLLCGSSSNDTSCLTPVQANTVRLALSPLYGEDGKLLYPAMQPGSEEEAFTWVYSGEVPLITEQWYRYGILNDPTWDPATLTLADMAYADELDPANISTWNGDISAFRAKGGKLQTYHGLADPAISSENSARYYNHVSETMNLLHTDLDDFYRFYRISGMSHCFGGVGAWEIGQSSSDVPATASHNILFSLIDWVEKGRAPDTILGTKYINDTKSLGVRFQRNHCRYPYRNKYIGGDPNVPSSWNCELYPTL